MSLYSSIDATKSSNEQGFSNARLNLIISYMVQPADLKDSKFIIFKKTLPGNRIYFEKTPKTFSFTKHLF